MYHTVRSVCLSLCVAYACVCLSAHVYCMYVYAYCLCWLYVCAMLMCCTYMYYVMRVLCAIDNNTHKLSLCVSLLCVVCMLSHCMLCYLLLHVHLLHHCMLVVSRAIWEGVRGCVRSSVRDSANRCLYFFHIILR